MPLEALSWRTEKRKVSDLIPWDHNPRRMTEKQAKDLEASLARLNLIDIPAIDTDGRIVGGHQRAQILMAMGRGAEEIDVRVPNRKLTEGEFVEANLRLNKNVGEWNTDELANFGEDILKTVGFTEGEVASFFDLEPAEEILLDQAVQLKPQREYAVIMCETEEEWDQLRVALNLKEVRRGGYRKGSQFDAIGTERVVRAERFLKLLEVAK